MTMNELKKLPTIIANRLTNHPIIAEEHVREETIVVYVYGGTENMDEIARFYLRKDGRFTVNFGWVQYGSTDIDDVINFFLNMIS